MFFHVPSYLIPASAFVLFIKYNKCIGFSFMISENVLLNAMQIDPYLRIGEDLQLYVRLQSDLGSYGSESDQEVARSVLSDCRTKVGINDQRVLDVIASALSDLIEVSLFHGWYDFAICCFICFFKMKLHYQMGKDVLAKELTEMFTPEEMPLFGSNSALDWANFNAQAFSDESLSFDEVGCLH